MRWPDIFFRARKPREEQPAAAKTTPETTIRLASTSIPTTAIKPASVLADAPPPSDKAKEPRLSPPAGSNSPALRPAVRATKPVVLSTTPAAIPIATQEDPMKVFARANSIRLAKKADQAGVAVETPSPASSEPSKEPVTETSPSPATEVPPPSAIESNFGAPTSATTTRRKAKLTDLARIIPSTESTEPEPAIEPPSTVSPPAFTVAVPIGSFTQPDASAEKRTQTTPEPEKKPDAPVSGQSAESAAPITSGPAPIPAASDAAPKSDSPSPTPPFDHLPAKASEKKEFLLVNGERIFGSVLSETPDTVYLDHSTLGVLTLPRSQIAARPVEIILINGDRIVGDIMAETPDSLYVRHASLGMLTVPRAQRSTRVVEAILKDGDRILGEVLAETENYTVIRSATLGTVPVPHDKISMLNRKLEQVTLKSLPNAAPALEDKPKS